MRGVLVNFGLALPRRRQDMQITRQQYWHGVIRNQSEHEHRTCRFGPAETRQDWKLRGRN